MREIIVAGNWKMNTLPWEGVELARSLALSNKGHVSPLIVLCPPATHLFLIKSALRDTSVVVASQNIHWEHSGAFTGEISADMLLSIGISWAIIGHSERRQYFGETDQTVNQRTKRAIEAGIRPIVCIGETLAERDSGQTFSVLERQIDVGLKDVHVTGYGGVVIAYEPVWAIGTGRTASPEQAQEAHAFIRAEIGRHFGHEIAAKTVIQYGGSVNEINAASLMVCPDVDGALVGGASLTLAKFNTIIESARNKRIKPLPI